MSLESIRPGDSVVVVNRIGNTVARVAKVLRVTKTMIVTDTRLANREKRWSKRTGLPSGNPESNFYIRRGVDDRQQDNG